MVGLSVGVLTQCPRLSNVASLRIALCQINTVVGDLGGNVDRILEASKDASAHNCDLAVFPELTITGYPPEDLLLKPRFVADNRLALEAVVKATSELELTVVVGFVDGDNELYNSAAVCRGGRLVGVYHKRLLPNYAVFDEQRYFRSGDDPLQLFEIDGVRFGVSICEDVWSPSGPVAHLADMGARIVVNLNASPFHAGRVDQRQQMLASRSKDNRCALVYVNQVGGQDELVFDGASMSIGADGLLISRAPQFLEHVQVVEIDGDTGRGIVGEISPRVDSVEEVYGALVTGTRDYVTKNGFSGVLIGLSGGIDSSLVALIAVDALGSENVHGVSMPSRFSSEGSKTDAAELASRLGVSMRVIPIEPAHHALLEMLHPSIGDRPPNLTEENLQSRIRGVLLMALSNEFGWMVLTTGNKSEMAVGYSTLYGDTAGGFAVIKDIPKTLVYELCRYRNRTEGRELVSEAVLTKAPSAELRANQRDDQSLPPYELLDPIIESYVEQDMTRSELEDAGFDAAVVERVTRLIDVAEYKRRQSPPGVRVTTKAFGKDRRLPITNGYDG